MSDAAAGMSLADLSATELSERLARGAVSAVEAMTAALDRIEAVNPALNAIVSLRPRADLLAEAAEADRSPRRGWLHGMPLAPKDLVATGGLRTTWGSPLYADHVPEADDLAAARMRAAGAIFIGKTNVPEWGLGSHSFNAVFGVTRNPYDLSRTAGGSSGGAAAALAARLLPVADGSDAMGSLRNPAAFCNVYGFRPSVGLVPRDAVGDTYLSTLSTEGPMGRSVEDVARLLETLAGPNPGTPFDRPAEPFAAGLDAPVAGLRIGWLGDWGGAFPMEPGILALCETALRGFEELACAVVPLSPPYPAEEIWSSWTTLRAFLNAGSRRGLHADPATRALLKPEAIWEIEQGLDLPAADVYAASVTRSAWFARLGALFRTVDFLALPSAQVWPFPANWRYPDVIAGTAMDTYHRWMGVMVPVSLAGLPCLSVPVGFGAESLPMGMQLAGPSGADRRVLQLGQAWHRATGWPLRRPPADPPAAPTDRAPADCTNRATEVDGTESEQGRQP